MPSLICCQDVISQLLEPLQTDGNIPVPTMKLTKTIRNKRLKYKDMLKLYQLLLMTKCLLQISSFTETVNFFFIVIHITNIWLLVTFSFISINYKHWTLSSIDSDYHENKMISYKKCKKNCSVVCFYYIYGWRKNISRNDKT